MTTPIRPSLAQMLNPQGVSAQPAAQPTAQQTQAAAGFNSALAAQRAFFQQITQPKIAPATYTAADIAQATSAPAAVRVAPVQSVAPAQLDPSQPLKRPGSFLNIVI